MAYKRYTLWASGKLKAVRKKCTVSCFLLFFCTSHTPIINIYISHIIYTRIIPISIYTKLYSPFSVYLYHIILSSNMGGVLVELWEVYLVIMGGIRSSIMGGIFSSIMGNI